MTSSEAPSSTAQLEAWRGFKPGLWQRDINVRWFIQRNYTPYEGDGAFLAPATERTKRLWNTWKNCSWRNVRRACSTFRRFIERCAFGATKAWTAYCIASEEVPEQRRVRLRLIGRSRA